MSGFFEKIKKMFPVMTERTLVYDYFQDAWRHEYENQEIYGQLIPIIKYPFIQDEAKVLLEEQQSNCKQIEIELAANQVNPPLKPDEITIQMDYPSTFHARTALVNQLLENNKTLAALYNHLSFMDTIVPSRQYEQLRNQKEDQIRRIQDLVLKLN